MPSNEKKLKYRVSNGDEVVNIVYAALFPGEDKPTLDQDKLTMQKLLPHGALLDSDAIAEHLRLITDLEAKLSALSDKKGNWKVEIEYKEGRDNDSPFGSKSPDKVVFRMAKSG